MRETLAARGTQGMSLLDLSLVRLAAGEREAIADPGELCAVVLSGAIQAAAGGSSLGRAGRQGDVFDSLGDAVYVPPALTLELTAETDAVVAVASAPVEGRAAGQARIIRPADQHVGDVGAGNWSRTIRRILGPEDDAGRLLLGETVNPPGNWSSYPPHKHDRQAPPEEVALEELYLYRFKPETGFGVQLLYDDNIERAQVVRDGDVVAIPSGYHPVVAAPGYSLYYLWVMAGTGREMAPYLDPRHSWVLGDPSG
jgi:5-deoxy-glucuronate isomerase